MGQGETEERNMRRSGNIGVAMVLAGLLLGTVGFGGSTLLAQSPSAKETERSRPDPERMQQERERAQKETLERLKETDPAAYERQKAFFERDEQIRKILKAFQSKQLSEAEAERQLYPLVKANVQTQGVNFDAQIAQTRAQLEQLEAFKRDPGLLVKQQIDAMLGRGKKAEDRMNQQGEPSSPPPKRQE